MGANQLSARRSGYDYLEPYHPRYSVDSTHLLPAQQVLVSAA